MPVDLLLSTNRVSGRYCHNHSEKYQYNEPDQNYFLFLKYIDRGFPRSSKTMLVNQQCVPDLNQICGSGTTPDFSSVMGFATSMGSMIGGTLLETNTLPLLVGAIGVNPIITGLVGITLAGIVGQTAWFVHRRKKSVK